LKSDHLKSSCRRWFGSFKGGTARRSKRAFGIRPMSVEPLEERLLLSVTSVTDNNIAFQTVDQSLFDIGPDEKIQAKFSESLFNSDLTPVELGGYFLGTGIEIKAFADLELGLSGDLHVSGGTVGADYRTDITVSALTASGEPVSGTNLTAGDTFILSASESPDPGAIALQTEFGSFGAGLSLDYAFEASAAIRGKILGKTVINEGVHELVSGSQKLITEKLNLVDGTGELRLLGGAAGKLNLDADNPTETIQLKQGILSGQFFLPELDTGISGDTFDDSTYLNGTNEVRNKHLPVDRTQSSTTGQPVEGQTRIDFFKLGIGVADIIGQFTQAPISGVNLSKIPNVDFIVSLINADVDLFFGVAQKMTFTPLISVNYNFLDADNNPTFASVETSPGSGLFTQKTSMSVPLGQDLAVIHGGGTLNIDTDYVLTGEFQNVTSIYLSPAFSLDLLRVETSGSLVEDSQDNGLLPNDLDFSLFSGTLPLGPPAKIGELFNETFDLGGFVEKDGADLSLDANAPTSFTVLALADDPTKKEGRDVQVQGTIFDPNGAADGSDTYTLNIDWKDGTTQTVVLDGSTTSTPNGVRFDPNTRVFTAQHRYVDEIGEQNVKFTATRMTGSQPSDDVLATVKITNFKPQVGLDPLFIDNNGNATLTGSYTDRGVQDSQLINVTWGDGSNTSLFRVSAADSLTVGDSFDGTGLNPFARTVPAVLIITSVNTATGKVGFEVTGKSYAGRVPTGPLRMLVKDEDGGSGADNVPIPWGFDLFVHWASDVVIDENDRARLNIRFTDTASYGFGSSVFSIPPSQTYNVVVDWDDPNDPRDSTFDVTINFALVPFTVNEYAATPEVTNTSGDDAILSVRNVNFSFETFTDKNGDATLGWVITPEIVVRRRYLDDGTANGNGTASDVSNVVVSIFEADLQGHRGGTVIQDVTVNNLAPTLALQPMSEVGVGGAAVLSGTIADTGTLDAFTLKVDWADGSSLEEFTFDPGTRSFTVSHVYTKQGSFIIDATLLDDDANSGTASQTVLVDFNKAPVAYADVVSTNADQSLLIDVLADHDGNPDTFGDVDPEGNLDPARTINLTSPDFGTLTNNHDGTFTFDPTTAFADLSLGEEAVVQFSYQIEDTEGETDTATVKITVVGVNNVPAVTVENSSVAVNEGQTAFNSGAWSDIDTNDVVTLSSSAGTVTGNDDGTWSWSFDTNDGPNDTATVTITAKDSVGAEANTTFGLTVLNVAPALTVDNKPVVIDEGQSTSKSIVASDVPADTVSLAASIGTIADNGNGTWTWNYDGIDDLPTTQATITASDEDGGSTAVNFDLTVNNVAPTLNVDVTPVVIDEGNVTSKIASASDVPADTVSLAASIGTIVDNGDGTWTWIYDGTDDLATTQVTITASDEDGGSTAVNFDLTVNNVAPTLNVDVTPVVIDEGNVTSKIASASDVPADTVSLAASIGTIASNGDGTWTWNYDGADDLATTQVTIVASDEDGGSMAVNFDLTVNNVAPTIDSVAIVGLGNRDEKARPGELVTFTGAFSDEGSLDSHTVVIDWGEIADDAPHAADDRTVLNVAASDLRSFTETHAYSTGGIFTVTVTVTDDDAGSDFDSSTWVYASGVRLDPNTGKLQIVGTAGKDIVNVKLVEGHNDDDNHNGPKDPMLKVTANLDVHEHGKDGDGDNGNNKSRQTFLFDPADVSSIHIVLCDGDDHAKVGPGDDDDDDRPRLTIPTVIEGDGGDDHLTGGSGNDVLLGGSGDDKLYGRDGNDILRGGAGDDRLKGDGGLDILLGGLGRDVLKGGHDDDILIGGSTTLNDEQLAAASVAWDSQDDYDTRVAAITELLNSIVDDGVRDRLFGNAGLDFFVQGVDDVYRQ
jgi:Bacterial Ig domain/RTX calcium-binding nonapeptide repeat (4 copies)